MYQKEKEQKLLDEETPIEEIFDHTKVFLMACSSAPKNADDDYSDNFEADEIGNDKPALSVPNAHSTMKQEKDKRIWSTKPPKIPNKLSKHSMTLSNFVIPEAGIDHGNYNAKDQGMDESTGAVEMMKMRALKARPITAQLKKIVQMKRMRSYSSSGSLTMKTKGHTMGTIAETEHQTNYSQKGP